MSSTISKEFMRKIALAVAEYETAHKNIEVTAEQRTLNFSKVTSHKVSYTLKQEQRERAKSVHETLRKPFDPDVMLNAMTMMPIEPAIKPIASVPDTATPWVVLSADAKAEVGFRPANKLKLD